MKFVAHLQHGYAQVAVGLFNENSELSLLRSKADDKMVKLKILTLFWKVLVAFNEWVMFYSKLFNYSKVAF